MVAKIIIGKKIRGVLHYNENKVSEGSAQLILASAFGGEIEQMDFNQKLQRFENLLMLKPKVKTNTLHISLNFDAAEKLKDDALQQIAIAYMDKIGFGDQPFLVYRHHDAAHHHIHLVTTNIQSTGEPISLHNIGRIQSEKARKEIEQEFGLVQAQSKNFKPEPGVRPVDLQKALYGKIPTKRAISNTVNAVTRDYKFSSLAEFNAILNQFNVVADRGTEDTEMFQKRGLIYSLLDQKGEKTGVPIKSSTLYSKPTLPWLEQEFEKHRQNKMPLKVDLRNAVDRVLEPGTLVTAQAFGKALNDRGINVLFRQSSTGQIYGITFVDNVRKVVFNGSDLGNSYSAKAIVNRLSGSDPEQKLGILSQSNPMQQRNKTANQGINETPHFDRRISETNTRLLEVLIAPAQDVISPLPKKKKKKKRGLTI